MPQRESPARPVAPPATDPRIALREARRLEQAGRLVEAIAVYEQLLAREPALPESWYNLAVLQRRTGRFEGALTSYRQALERGVSRPEEAHLNRGVIYSDCLRQDAAAERELETALALNPSYFPALLNLANLKTDLGRRDEALALYERILALDPDCCDALARYAETKPFARADDPVLERIRTMIARPDVALADKATLGFALGKALDGCAAYDDAFAAYAAANRASRDSAGRGAVLYDRRGQEQFIDRLIASFGPAHPRVEAPASAAPPLFVCGMFRSGSTLTEQVLAGHSRVRAGGEIDFLPRLVQGALAPFPARMRSLGSAQLEAIANAYRAHLATLFPGAGRVTDKRPDNFLYIGLIKALFPDARIVHTTREPLDNCLSIYFLHLDPGMGYALDLGDIAHYYRQYRRLMAHWKSLYGADILDFDYDLLVREPRPAVERLLAFCGLDWEEGCLAFHRLANAVKTASAWQVREPLYTRSSGRWRNYARHVESLRAALGDLSR
jgi:tetratricopeptide (TPR) repeat protein